MEKEAQVSLKLESKLLSETENVAKQAWDAHEQTQPTGLADDIEVALLAEELLEVLSKYSGPSQLRKGMYFDQQWGFREQNVCLLGINIHQEGTHQIAETSGIRFISFGTYPEQTLVANPRRLRGLVVSGAHSENGHDVWETKYTFDGFTVKKRERVFEAGIWYTLRDGLALELADFRLMRNMLGNMRQAMLVTVDGRNNYGS